MMKLGNEITRLVLIFREKVLSFVNVSNSTLNIPPPTVTLSARSIVGLVPNNSSHHAYNASCFKQLSITAKPENNYLEHIRPWLPTDLHLHLLVQCRCDFIADSRPGRSIPNVLYYTVLRKIDPIIINDCIFQSIIKQCKIKP